MPRDVNTVDELDAAEPGASAGPPALWSPEPQRGRRRGTKGEQTRRAITEAALRLFREHGYEATTMRAIAQEAGWPPGTRTTTSAPRRS
jgi:hypothetical protein